VVLLTMTRHRTCDLQVAASSPGWAPLHQATYTVCLCHQAVWFDTGHGWRVWSFWLGK